METNTTTPSTDVTTADDAAQAAADVTPDTPAQADLEEQGPAATPEPADDVAPGPTKHATAADVEEAMRDVVDPELGINIVDLGLVYGATVDANNHATLDMTLTSAACPLTDVIEDQTAEALKPIVSGHTINWVWMPPWGPNMITDDGREMLRALGFNL